MSTSETSRTDLEYQFAILEEIVSDSDMYFTWEQVLDIEDIIRSIDEDDSEAIQQHFAKMLYSLNLPDTGFTLYEEVLVALRER